VATAVELRVDIRKSSLPPDVKEWLIALAGRHVTTEGVLVVDSRVHRSQAQNRDAAREKRLASKKLKGAVKHSRSRRAKDE
jgi:ribosome-associated protein